MLHIGLKCWAMQRNVVFGYSKSQAFWKTILKTCKCMLIWHGEKCAQKLGVQISKKQLVHMQSSIDIFCIWKNIEFYECFIKISHILFETGPTCLVYIVLDSKCMTLLFVYSLGCGSEAGWSLPTGPTGSRTAGRQGSCRYYFTLFYLYMICSKPPDFIIFLYMFCGDIHLRVLLLIKILLSRQVSDGEN